MTSQPRQGNDFELRVRGEITSEEYVRRIEERVRERSRANTPMRSAKGFQRWLCRVGLHGPFTYLRGALPSASMRRCSTCGARWQGTHDGIEPGWRRVV